MDDTPEAERTVDAFERLLAAPREGHYVLQLYVSGMSPRSTTAIRELKEICEQLLPDSYSLEIIDLYDQPSLASEHQIVAAPTLIRHRPLPVRRMVGDLTNRELVLRTLDLA